MEISAKVIQDSITVGGVRLVTLELEYPRFIHSEFMTHRVFSRNAASSRAIPIEKMMEQVVSDPAMPVYWGINKAGMQADEEHPDVEQCQSVWRKAARAAVYAATELKDLGLHKQVVNRLLEPFQMMKTVVSATDWANFFALRAHPDAQPEIQELAMKMQKVMESSTPVDISMGGWHVPYVYRFEDTETGQIQYGIDSGGDIEEITKDQAIMISASCCAQVSYRKNDDSIEKAEKIYDLLVNNKPIHASPFEHQARPAYLGETKTGNFRGWLQNRQILGE
jgi:thymidylate synthase ThyX